MNIENIMNNNDQKVIFLKAILLGITYGESSNINKYKDSIEKEILKLSNKDIIQSNNLNENNLNNNNLNNNNLNSANNIILEKYKNIILNLENQRVYTINLINNLSNSHYGYNYSRINLLKNNLNLINREIDKNRISMRAKMPKEISKTNIFGENINANIFRKKAVELNNISHPSKYSLLKINPESLKNAYKITSNVDNISHNHNRSPPEIILKSFEESIQPMKTIIRPTVVNNHVLNIDKKENLVGELEKTLGNLSNLLIN